MDLSLGETARVVSLAVLSGSRSGTAILGTLQSIARKRIVLAIITPGNPPVQRITNTIFIVVLSIALDGQETETISGVINAEATEIGALPFRVTESGTYRLAADLTHGGDSGAAVLIEADDVVIDLDGHTLTGSNHTSTAAVGVLAADRQHVVIRDGTVTGFYFGIDLRASAGMPRRSVGHVVTNVTANGNTYFGIRVVGASSRIQRCHVLDTGGSTREGHTIPIGIRLVGERNVLCDCCVRNLHLARHADGRGEMVGVHFDDAIGGVMDGNRIIESATPRDTALPRDDDDRERRFGVWVNGGPNRNTYLRVINNHVAGFGVPLVFSPGADGEAVGNVFYGAGENPIRGNPTGKVSENESHDATAADLRCGEAE
jgi:hypothetical protein